MSDDKGDDGSVSEFWLLENQCLDEIDNEADIEVQFQEQKELTYQKLWHLFQGAATCVAHLHKGSHSYIDRNTRWTPFQTAAGSVTALYKESVDGVRRCAELAVLYGRQKRTRELVSWLRRRRTVRRDELLAFLAGRPASPHTLRQTAPHRCASRAAPLFPHQLSFSDRQTPSRQTSAPSLRRLTTADTGASGGVSGSVLGAPATALTKDVFTLNSLQGAMSSVCVQSPDLAGLAATASVLLRSPSRRHSTTLSDGSRSPADPQTHLKRSASPAPCSSPADVTMHSPIHKRARFS